MSGNCETCGNRYEYPMTIHIQGKSHLFDCFECAIQSLAPRCTSCGVPVIGHGVEVDQIIYCSAHCSRLHGERGLCDHRTSRIETAIWGT